MSLSTTNATPTGSLEKLRAQLVPSPRGQGRGERDGDGGPTESVRPEPGLLDHPAVAAWCRLTHATIDPLRIEVLKEKTKCVVYRLHAVLPGGVVANGHACGGAQSIIAKKTLSRSTQIEWRVYEKLLRGLSVRSLRLYGFVEEKDAYWLFMEDAVGEEYSPANEEHRALAGDWLGTVHLQITENVAALPDRSPNYYRRLLCNSREILRQHLSYPLLSSEDVRLLRSIIEQFDRVESHWEEIERIAAAISPTLVHGDLVRKNVRVQRREGRAKLLVFDWENAGFGVPAIDLTQFTGSTVSPDLDAYCLANPMPVKTGVRLARIASWGRVFRLLESIRWTTSKMCFKPNDPLINPIACLRIYKGQMSEALAALQWRSLE